MGDHEPALLDKGEEQCGVEGDGGEVVEEDTRLPVGQGKGEEVEHLPAPVDQVGGQHTEMRYSVHQDLGLLDIQSGYRAQYISDLGQCPEVLHHSVEVVEEGGGCEDPVHDAGSEESLPEAGRRHHVKVGGHHSEVVELAEECHGGSGQNQSHNVAPDKERGEIVEDILEMVPVFNEQKSLIPEKETAESDDVYDYFIRKLDAL